MNMRAFHTGDDDRESSLSQCRLLRLRASSANVLISSVKIEVIKGEQCHVTGRSPRAACQAAQSE